MRILKTSRLHSIVTAWYWTQSEGLFWIAVQVNHNNIHLE